MSDDSTKLPRDVSILFQIMDKQQAANRAAQERMLDLRIKYDRDLFKEHKAQAEMNADAEISIKRHIEDMLENHNVPDLTAWMPSEWVIAFYNAFSAQDVDALWALLKKAYAHRPQNEPEGAGE